MLLLLQYSNDTQVQALLSYSGLPSPPTISPPPPSRQPTVEPCSINVPTIETPCFYQSRVTEVHKFGHHSSCHRRSIQRVLGSQGGCSLKWELTVGVFTFFFCLRQPIITIDPLSLTNCFIVARVSIKRKYCLIKGRDAPKHTGVEKMTHDGAYGS